MFGERIKRARIAEGLSLRELSKKVDLSATMLSKYERNLIAPSSDLLLKIADALNTPVEFFFRPHTVTFSNPKFRKRNGLGEKEFSQIKEKTLEQAERLFKLLTYFPKSPIADFFCPSSLPDSIDSLVVVERTASLLRDSWALGQDEISSVIDTLESKGVFVFIIDFSHKFFDGLTALINGFKTIIISADWPGDRQRFTLAHELGHIILDGRLKNIDEEKACNRFAGAFLVPKSAISENLGEKRNDISIQELTEMKEKFGASMASILFRLSETGILSEKTKKEKWLLFKQNGWDRKEPGQDIAAEKTMLLERLVLRATTEQFISIPKGAEFLNISSVELKRLLGNRS